jgi:hypothetical protein
MACSCHLLDILARKRSATNTSNLSLPRTCSSRRITYNAYLVMPSGLENAPTTFQHCFPEDKLDRLGHIDRLTTRCDLRRQSPSGINWLLRSQHSFKRKIASLHFPGPVPLLCSSYITIPTHLFKTLPLPSTSMLGTLSFISTRTIYALSSRTSYDLEPSSVVWSRSIYFVQEPPLSKRSSGSHARQASGRTYDFNASYLPLPNTPPFSSTREVYDGVQERRLVYYSAYVLPPSYSIFSPRAFTVYTSHR